MGMRSNDKYRETKDDLVTNSKTMMNNTFH